MKRIIAGTIIILILISLCGCSNVDNNQVYTETQENLLITYIYDEGDIISKSVYNNSTEITIIYTYYYNNNGWGRNVVGTSVISVTKDGEIIDTFFVLC